MSVVRAIVITGHHDAAGGVRRRRADEFSSQVRS